MRGRALPRETLTDHAPPAVEEDAAELGALTETRSGQPLSEPIKAQLDRVSAQIDGLQQRLDAFIARRNEAIADRASERVASIVAAAEKSAAKIKAGAESHAAGLREQVLADVRTEVEMIRSRAHADAARIRAEAHAEAARARDKAISEASAEIQEVCSRLSDELKRGASAALARITGRGRPPTSAAPATQVAVSACDPLRQSAVELSGRVRAKEIAHEVKGAVAELQNAATVLEHSLRNFDGGADEPQPAGAA